MESDRMPDLWTPSFVRLSLGNLFLFVSLYMLLPVLPVVMGGRLGLPIYWTGSIFLFFTLGMCIAGPFYNYLIDTYKRKLLALLSFALLGVGTVGYVFVSNFGEFVLLALLQGVMLGVVTTMIITLAIDISASHCRSAANMAFAWLARLGMILGISVGLILDQIQGLETIIYSSVAIGAVGVLCLMGVHIPFRAPIGVKVCSRDRFILPQGWLPVINLVLVAVVPGILIPAVPQSYTHISLWYVPIPFFIFVGLGFLLSVLVARLLFRGEKTWLQIVCGLLLIVVGLAILIDPDRTIGAVAAALLIGFGIGLTTPQFLLLFIRLSDHCQRGTANTTHLLAWKLGISLGILITCYFTVYLTPQAAFQAALLSAVLALLFFIAITYPYYKRKKVR